MPHANAEPKTPGLAATWGLFLPLAAAVYAAEIAIAGSIARFPHPDVLAAAVVVDLAVVVPVLFWATVVRRGRAPHLASVPWIAIGIVAAGAMLPAAHDRAVAVAHLVLVPLELAVVAWIGVRAAGIVRAARAGGDDDFLTAMRAATADVLGRGRIARAIGDETAVAGYALGLARRPAERGFTHHRETAYAAIVAAVALAGVVEIAGVHILVARWSVAAAWVVTGLSVYAGLWLAADLRAVHRRRTTLESDRLVVRLGLRWTVEIPYHAIVRVTSATGPADPDPAPGKPLVLRLVGGASVRLVLDRAIVAHGPYGIVRRARTIDLAIDESARFVRELGERCPARPALAGDGR